MAAIWALRSRKENASWSSNWIFGTSIFGRYIVGSSAVVRTKKRIIANSVDEWRGDKDTSGEHVIGWLRWRW
jgi:hypothetical protein